MNTGEMLAILSKIKYNIKKEVENARFHICGRSGGKMGNIGEKSDSTMFRKQSFGCVYA
ncbi:MAG: hypothetical protein PHX51_04505 [Clostridia bacterium]|nr:hypothetical protein [Clostridia bacterium]